MLDGAGACHVCCHADVVSVWILKNTLLNLGFQKNTVATEASAINLFGRYAEKGSWECLSVRAQGWSSRRTEQRRPGCDCTCCGPNVLLSWGLCHLQHQTPNLNDDRSPLCFQTLLGYERAFQGDASDKEPTCQCKRCKRCKFNSWVRKVPWRRAWRPTALFLPGEFHGQRSLVGYSS